MTENLQKKSWIYVAAGILAILNVLDAVLTILWVETGCAVEANPIMDYFLSIHPVLFLLVKMFLVYGGIGILLHYRQKPIATFSLWIFCLVYGLLLCYHIFHAYALCGLFCI